MIHIGVIVPDAVPIICSIIAIRCMVPPEKRVLQMMKKIVSHSSREEKLNLLIFSNQLKISMRSNVLEK